MTMTHKTKMLLALLALGLAGCAAQAQKDVIVYPPPPEEPRFEWIGTYHSEGDFKKEGFAGVLQEMGGAQVEGSSFTGPMSVTVNPDGLALVSDLYAQNVKVLDLERKSISEFGNTTFRNNFGIATDQQGLVYIADGKSREVQVFSRDGERLRTIGDQEVFEKPAFLVVNDALGRLYVSDSMANAIRVFTLAGEYLFSFGERGNAPGQLYAPQGLAFDRAGRLFVADMYNARIQVFAADGTYLEHFGQRGNFHHQFENPKGLAFDSDGNLYVVDSRRPNFRIFTPDGTLLLMVGGERPATHKLGFKLPTGIHVDRFDRVFITDLLGKRVTVWQYLSSAYLKRSQAP